MGRKMEKVVLQTREVEVDGETSLRNRGTKEDS